MKKLVCLIFVMSSLFSCTKNNSGGEQESTPTVTTTAVSALTGSGANSGGNISAEGGSAVTESNGSNDVLVMWKNGVSTPLTNGTFNARSFSIFVK